MVLESIPWQILIVISAILTSFSLGINKYQTSKASSLQIMSFKYLGSFLTVGSYWLFFNRQITDNWWVFFGYGMLVAMNVGLYTVAQRINMSQTSLMDPIGHIMGVFLAIVVLAEWSLLTQGQAGIKILLALILAPIVIWLFYDKKMTHSKKWIKIMILYLISLAIFKVVVKVFLNSSQAEIVLMWQYLGSLVAARIGVNLKKQPLKLGGKFILTGILQGMIGSSSILMVYTALRLTTVTQTTLLRLPIVVILTTLSGLWGFKEISTMTRKKWAGVSLAFVILLLVLTSSL